MVGVRMDKDDAVTFGENALGETWIPKSGVFLGRIEPRPFVMIERILRRLELLQCLAGAGLRYSQLRG